MRDGSLVLFFGDFVVHGTGDGEECAESVGKIVFAHGLVEGFPIFVAHVAEFVVEIDEDGVVVIAPCFLVIPCFAVFPIFGGFNIGEVHIIDVNVDDPAIAVIVVVVHHIFIGDVAVTVIAPIGTPRVSDDEDLIDVRIADAEHGMSAVGSACRFIFCGHGDEAFSALSVEGIEEGHSEDDGFSFGEDFFEFVEFDFYLIAVADSAIFGDFVAAFFGAFADEFHAIRPLILIADTLFLEGFDGVTDGGTVVFIFAVFDFAGIVVDEEPACFDVQIRFGSEEVFEGTDGGIRRAAVDLSLIFDVGHEGAKIDFFGEL